LGKLLYAIAIADGFVQEEEKYNLHRFVLKELAHHERTYDSSGMNQAFYVDFEFESYVKEHPELNGTAKNFGEFVEENIEPGDKQLLERSIQLMENVATAYSKGKEKTIIDQVRSKTDHYLRLCEIKK
jgi:hypothetical protein